MSSCLSHSLRPAYTHSIYRNDEYVAGKVETTCPICKCGHLTISYSGTRHHPWKNRLLDANDKRGHGFVLDPENEAALSGHANVEWKYKFAQMRGKKNRATTSAINAVFFVQYSDDPLLTFSTFD